MWPEFLRVKGFYLRMQSLSFPCSLDSQYSAQIICSFHAHRWRSCYVVGTVTKGRRLRVRRHDFFTQGSGFATNSLTNRNVPLLSLSRVFYFVSCAPSLSRVPALVNSGSFTTQLSRWEIFRRSSSLLIFRFSEPRECLSVLLLSVTLCDA